MANFFDRFRRGERQPARPFSEQGKPGFTVSGGVIISPETNPSIAGANRFRVASDLLANVSIIAASLRYSLNLVARPDWKCEPPNDSAEAKAAAEFMEEVLDGIDASWTRIVRRAAMYRYHGFGINEWVAKRREDGKIGIASIEARPQHTIERWELDANGLVVGVWQRDPQDSHEIYLPRQKLIYLVDDTLTDRPDGMGWFRHLVDPSNRLKTYLKLEGIGFQRDLTGIPIGRAPLHKLNELVESGDLTAEQATEMVNGLKDFCKLETKTEKTGLILDSQPYVVNTDTGENVSAIFEWGVELLKGDQSSIDKLGEAIRRIEFEMAAIMGTASMLTGREGEGSRALSEDQSRNLYLTVNATLADMAEAFDRDIVGPIWAMNGLSDDLRPKLKTEDASFKDVEQVARVLRDMATAGAVLAPDDPAIDDVRDLMGVSRAKLMSLEDLALLRGQGKDDPDEEDLEDEDETDPQKPKGKPPNRPSKGQGQARKYDPNQPRDPGGEDGGQWTESGADDPELPLERKATIAASERFDPNKMDDEQELGITPEDQRLATKIDRSFVAEEELTAGERETIRYYSSDQYHDINGALRAGALKESDVEAEVGALDSAIAKEKTAAPITLYRGLRANATGADDLPVGSIVSDAGFASTSAHANSGARFAAFAADGDHQAVLLRIKVPKGANALHLHPGRGVLGSEHEVLLPRGSKMRVLSAPKAESFRVYNEDRSYPVVDVELVP